MLCYHYNCVSSANLQNVFSNKLLIQERFFIFFIPYSILLLFFILFLYLFLFCFFNFFLLIFSIFINKEYIYDKIYVMCTNKLDIHMIILSSCDKSNETLSNATSVLLIVDYVLISGN